MARNQKLFDDPTETSRQKKLFKESVEGLNHISTSIEIAEGELRNLSN
jgi:hypothetical protein